MEEKDDLAVLRAGDEGIDDETITDLDPDLQRSPHSAFATRERHPAKA